jgi:hypothetical protein
VDHRDDRLCDEDEQRKGEERKWSVILWVIVVAVSLLALGYGLARWRFDVLTSLYG